MIWTIVAVLVILWLLGFSFGIGGSLIHALLVNCPHCLPDTGYWRAGPQLNKLHN